MCIGFMVGRGMPKILVLFPAHSSQKVAAHHPSGTLI